MANAEALQFLSVFPERPDNGLAIHAIHLYA
jgi:hypothetical protein